MSCALSKLHVGRHVCPALRVTSGATTWWRAAGAAPRGNTNNTVCEGGGRSVGVGGAIGGGGGCDGTRPHHRGSHHPQRRVPSPSCSSSSFVQHPRHVRCSSSSGGGGGDGDGRNTAQEDVEVDTDALIASYLSDAQVGQVRTFAATLLEWNKNMNLTGAATIDDVLQRHVADSLALIPAIEAALSSGSDGDGGGGGDGGDITTSSATGKVRILDVGSGAGFPGVALAIARPNWEVTLLDTLQKRTSFLDAAAADCGAGNVRTLWSRAEDAGKKGSVHRESYGGDGSSSHSRTHTRTHAHTHTKALHFLFYFIFLPIPSSLVCFRTRASASHHHRLTEYNHAYHA